MLSELLEFDRCHLMFLYFSPHGFSLDVKKSTYKKVHRYVTSHNKYQGERHKQMAAARELKFTVSLLNHSFLHIVKYIAHFCMQLSKFLSAMQDDGVVKIKEVSKGVESITEIDFKHTK